jgi:hypothetical protein
MVDTYTTSLRITQPQVGADTNTWGTLLNTDWSLVESAITGHVSVALTGATKTLTSNNGASDEARNQIIEFTGTPGTTCTVTVPAVIKLGLFINSTSDSSSVILTTGSGTTITIPADGFSYWTYCDGTNVVGVPVATRTRFVAPEFQIDTNFYSVLSSSNPTLNLDSNDYLTYLRSANQLTMTIGSSIVFAVGSGGAILTTAAPTSASDTGAAGTITWDSSYVYVCIATDTWKRSPLSSW